MRLERFDFDIQQLHIDALAYYERFRPQQHQICVTGTDKNSDPQQGAGSLVYDWSNNAKTPITNRLREDQFTEFLDVFKDDYVKTVYDQLSEHWRIGRLRFMYLRPKTALSWHRDTTARLHIPIVTDSDRTALVVENTVIRMPADGKAYYVDTTRFHTAFNAGDKMRIHLVAVLLD